MRSPRWISWKPAMFALAIVALVIVSVLARSGGMGGVGDAEGGSGPADGPIGDAAVSDGDHVDPVTGAVLVDLDDGATAEVRDEVGRRIASAIDPYPWPSGALGLGDMLNGEAQLFRLVPPKSELTDVLAALRGLRGVEEAEIERQWSIPETDPASVVSAATGGFPGEGVPAERADGSGRFRPNDPYYRYQWHLDQIGMPEAWTHTRGEGIVVAVVDTGVAYRTEGRFERAPDLAQTRFVPGYDFVEDDAYPDDEHGHGTHVAGTIAQSTNNALGVCGVAPAAAIMPLRVLDASGVGGWGAIAAAIRWAADHGAHILNMSFGGGMRSRTVERAIEYAYARGVVMVAAAGNASRSAVEYPARYRHVIAVGAVRFDRTLSFYSSYGDGLDLVAPGGDIRVDQNGDGMPDGVIQNTLVGRNPRRFDYLAYQGTSMAAPHVSGVAALVMASGVTDPDAVEHVLTATALDLGDRRRYGAGLVQANAAVRASAERVASRTPVDRCEKANAALRARARGFGAARGLGAVVLTVGVLFALRRRGLLGVGVVGSTTSAFVIAGGLGALPWHWVGLDGLQLCFADGSPGLIASLAEPWTGLLALSALVPFAVVLLLLQVPKFHPVLVGLSLGTAAYLLVEAVWPTVELPLVPSWFAGPWLLANAAAACWLGRQVARRR